SVRILAHRGASADFPENSLAAFKAAATQGADGVELDVMRCASGELVVCHDEQLTRLFGLSWWVHATPLRKLKPLGIPTLEQVFEALPSRMLVNVELKCETVDDRGLTREVGQLVERQSLHDRVLVSSFNPFCLVR